MRHLNLLPPARRDRLQREFLLLASQRFAAGLAGGLLLVSLGGVAAVGMMRALAAIDEGAGEEALAGPVQEYRTIRAEIAQYTQLFTAVDTLGKQRMVWSNLAAELLALVPAGATVRDVQVDGRTSVVTFSGTAPTRTQLVEFEDRLRALPWAKSIDAPRDNLLRAVNPSYRFSIQVDPAVVTGTSNGTETPQP
jgi:Tfp pilus assembly protein PilN